MDAAVELDSRPVVRAEVASASGTLLAPSAASVEAARGWKNRADDGNGPMEGVEDEISRQYGNSMGAQAQVPDAARFVAEEWGDSEEPETEEADEDLSVRGRALLAVVDDDLMVPGKDLPTSAHKQKHKSKKFRDTPFPMQFASRQSRAGSMDDEVLPTDKASCRPRSQRSPMSAWGDAEASSRPRQRQIVGGAWLPKAVTFAFGSGITPTEVSTLSAEDSAFVGDELQAWRRSSSAPM